MLRDQEIPDTPECHAARDRVREAAQELLDRAISPVTIGVVGEYSVGKSLLLGTLLGCPDLLPAEERPTTGNITVLSLTAGEPGSPTRAADDTEIRYLSEAQLSRCVQDILSSLITKLDKRHPELGAGTALAGYDPVADPRGWAPFDSWYPCLWPASPGAGTRPVPPEVIDDTHRDTVVELPIRDALLSQQGELSVLGQSVSVKRRIVNEALKLPAEKVTPPTPPKLTIQPFNRENVRSEVGDALSRSFPLIERVVQEVTVSPDHWALGGLLTEHRLRFLDFPGIGAAGSYGRDKSLSRRALVDVHTILLVLLSARPQSKGASEFWDMLLEDGRTPEALGQAALVASNIFDRTHLPSLAALPGSELPLPQLLRHADELNGIHVYGSKFVRGRQDGIVVTSAIPAIRRYELSYTNLSDHTRDRVRAAIGKLPPAGGRPREPIAARLEATEPANAWTPRLRAYDEDGGVGHLRTLIEEHVRKNGVAQKLERAERSRRKLNAALLTLQRQIHRSAAGENAAYREITEMFAELRYLLDKRVRPALHALHSPDPLAEDGGAAPDYGEAGVTGNLARPPGLATTAAAVHQDVFQWTQWHQLLERADRDQQHLVTKSRPPAADTTIWEDYFDSGDAGSDAPDDILGDADPAEDSSGIFVENFRQTVQEWSRNGNDGLREWCQDWAAHLAAGVRRAASGSPNPVRRSLLIESSIPAPRRIGEGPPAAGASLDLSRPREDGRKDHAEARPPGVGQERAGKPFPARPHHALAWHHLMRDLEEHIEERERHTLRVVELRQHTAVAAARTPVTDHLEELLGVVTEQLIPVYDQASAALLKESDIVPPRQDPPGDGLFGGPAIHPAAHRTVTAAPTSTASTSSSRSTTSSGPGASTDHEQRTGDLLPCPAWSGTEPGTTPHPGVVALGRRHFRVYADQDGFALPEVLVEREPRQFRLHHRPSAAPRRGPRRTRGAHAGELAHALETVGPAGVHRRQRGPDSESSPRTPGCPSAWCTAILVRRHRVLRSPRGSSGSMCTGPSSYAGPSGNYTAPGSVTVEFAPPGEQPPAAETASGFASGFEPAGDGEFLALRTRQPAATTSAVRRRRSGPDLHGDAWDLGNITHGW